MRDEAGMRDSAGDDLDTFLAARGFVAIPLRINAVGHFEVDALVDGQPARFILDTGASRTVVATPSAARLGLRTTASGDRAHGVGAGAHTTETAVAAELRLGDFRLTAVGLWVLDFQHVNRALEARGGAPVDGALGADLLRPSGAVIDYARAMLYLRQAATPDASARTTGR